ncbi:AI-2E family transporter [Nocardioides sp. zg-578]|uniref:AI-2E family transporter n=1 Tax=Nocardioides marmotae TaxID=2663857 RepID=A0A6I3IZL2_9ACTN|nr:AI-2E family transporter [Nocardioides marmotae]MCR6030515.1 AI-2E family transporter [Gordonia jinghuaiqii]MTB85748.1 AI-2E family transporter [Nocardioides marmotae]MTB94151.1 AI-2E family transporter [Nocardioides marmotae]QKE03351.1 AI-2E family transporter [Nocardioides marmotae]
MGSAPPDRGAEEHESRRRLPLPLPLRLPRSTGTTTDDDDGLAQRLAQQWAQMREDRRPAPAPIPTGPSNFSRAQVPWGLDLAAAWAWRLLVICTAGYVLLQLIGFFSVVTIPLAVALLVAALVSPLVGVLDRAGFPRGLAAISVVIAGLGLVGLLLTFAGQQVATGATDLADQTVKGLGQIKNWLKTGPLNASDSQINDYIDAAQRAISEGTRDGGVVSRATEVGATLTHLFAGFFIVLFATYFFLADGERIWAFLVRIAPRAAREHVDTSGRVAWVSLTQFVRATVIVALVDAIGISIVAAVLGVPFVLAIGVLVFLGAFIPMIGATVAGSVAVLVALVDQGPITALLMLAGVIVVQQVEGHVLQPFLLGRWVSVHPLAVIVAIAGGVVVAGVAGALVAVPLAAAGNAVVQHLASFTAPGDDPVEELAEDYEETGAQVEAPEDPESPL